MDLVAPRSGDADTADTAGEGMSLAGRGSSRTWLVLRRDRGAWVGAGLALAVIGAVVLAPVLSAHDPGHQYRELMPLDGRPLPPGGPFLLGTDSQGRDELARLLHAGRATLLVAFSATLIALAVGAAVGLAAGYGGTPRLRWRRWTMGVPVEGTLMRVTDVGLAFPTLLFAIALAAVLRPSLELVIVVIASALWASTARLVYARTLMLRSAEFIIASHALGTRPWRIMTRHLLPHLMPMLIVLFAMGLAVTVLFEVTLAYLGAGAPAGSLTWGRMLAESVSSYATDLRLPLLPAFAIFLTVYAFTLLGDALGDALDPRAWDH